jgi:hypothetical protein
VMICCNDMRRSCVRAGCWLYRYTRTGRYRYIQYLVQDSPAVLCELVPGTVYESPIAKLPSVRLSFCEPSLSRRTAARGADGHFEMHLVPVPRSAARMIDLVYDADKIVFRHDSFSSIPPGSQECCRSIIGRSYPNPKHHRS